MRVIDIHERQTHYPLLVNKKCSRHGELPGLITVKRGQVESELLLVDQARVLRKRENQSVLASYSIAHVAQDREGKLFLLGSGKRMIGCLWRESNKRSPQLLHLWQYSLIGTQLQITVGTPLPTVESHNNGTLFEQLGEVNRP